MISMIWCCLVHRRGQQQQSIGGFSLPGSIQAAGQRAQQAATQAAAQAATQAAMNELKGAFFGRK